MRRRWARFAAFGLGTVFTFVQPGAAFVAPCNKASFRIVLDVGHNPAMPGATSARGVTEYEFNLRLAAIVERRLVAHGYRNVFQIVMPSDADSFAQRTGRANALTPDLFLSIHHDSAQPQYFERWIYEGQERAYSDRFKGWSLFVSYANARFPESLRFAKLLADRLLASGLPFSAHHAEPIPGESKSFIDAARGIYRYDGLAVLKMTRAPAVLMESGVIVNRQEEAALASPARQNAMAGAVVEAVDGFCGS